jgi:hypothetical protein
MAFPRFVTDNSMDDTGFFLTWAEVPGTPGCGGLLTQVTNRRALLTGKRREGFLHKLLTGELLPQERSLQR